MCVKMCVNWNSRAGLASTAKFNEYEDFRFVWGRGTKFALENGWKNYSRFHMRLKIACCVTVRAKSLRD